MATDTATETWPTIEEVLGVHTRLADVGEEVEKLVRRYSHLAPLGADDFPGKVEVLPTLEAIGVMYTFIEHLKNEVDSLEGELRELRRHGEWAPLSIDLAHLREPVGDDAS